MTRGKQKPNPKLKADDDLQKHIPAMRAYVMGEIERLAPAGVPEITIPQLCTFMEAVLEQFPKSKLKGKVDLARDDVKSFSELCFASDFANRQKQDLLKGMLQFGDISQTSFESWKMTLDAEAARHHRDTVALILRLFSSLYETRPAHRPKKSHSSHAEEADEELLTRLFAKVAISKRLDGDTIHLEFTAVAAEAALRETIREALEDGLLKGLGDDIENPASKSSIDAHTKRLRRKLREAIE